MFEKKYVLIVYSLGKILIDVFGNAPDIFDYEILGILFWSKKNPWRKSFLSQKLKGKFIIYSGKVQD